MAWNPKKTFDEAVGQPTKATFTGDINKMKASMDPQRYGDMLRKGLSYEDPMGKMGKTLEEASGVLGGLDLRDGKPRYPGYVSINNLGSRAVIKPESVAQNAWTQLALKKQGLDQLRSLDNAVEDKATAIAQSRAVGGLRGGLSSGSNEMMNAIAAKEALRSMATQGTKDAMDKSGLMMTGAGRDYDLNKFNTDNLGKITKQNLANQWDDLRNRTFHEQGAYGEAMKLLAANRSADAMKDAAGGKK